MPKVTINGASGATPTSGAWEATTKGDCVIMTADGPATMLIHTPAGNIEIEVPAGSSVTVTLKPGIACVEFS